MKLKKETKSRKNNRIKALIFDVGGVLQLGNPSFDNPNVHIFVTRKLNTNLDQYFDSIDTVYAKAIEGNISEKKALDIMAKNLRTTPKNLKKFYLQAYKKYYILNKELLEFVIKIRRKGYKTAILSDQWYLSKKALFPKDFYNKFDATIISCDVGIRKPNPKIYDIVLRKLRLKPSQTVFIDNQKWNIAPAKKLGMKTILFKNNRQTINDLKKLDVKLK